MKTLNVVLALMICSVRGTQLSSAEAPAVIKPQKPEKVVKPLAAEDLADRAAALQANGQFAIDLYQKLAQTDHGNNVFVSPFSISIALTMATEGAVDQTLQQMTDVLHIPAGDLARIHRGQGHLLTGVIPVVSSEVTEKIARLRKELKSVNAHTDAMIKSNKFVEARSSSDTGRKLADELNSLVRQTSAYELQIANALWLEKSYPIQPNFISTLKPSYGTVVFPVDFKSRPEPVRTEINEWVLRQTNDRIRDLLSSGDITDLTRLVITNAVFFKGDWAEPFKPSATQPEPFQQSASQTITLPMMHQWNSTTASYGAFGSSGEFFPTPTEVSVELKDDDPSLYPDAGGHTMLALDYQGSKLKMILIVPQSVEGLSELERSLKYETLQQWIHSLKRRTVNLSLPKYKLEAKYHLRETLQSLGMVRAFEDPAKTPEAAQFVKLSTSEEFDDRLYITNVLHKTYVDVSEVGTEAAAATAVMFAAPTSAEVRKPPKTRPFVPIFKANKPFLFLIRDRETESILFIGRYVGQKV
ncbi:MAG: serpin family protein [Schlesneria sp.]